MLASGVLIAILLRTGILAMMLHSWPVSWLLGLLVAIVVGLVLAATARRSRCGGEGSTSIESGTPNLIRGQIRQNKGCPDRDPRTGRRPTAIMLPVCDENWIAGRIGLWIRVCRFVWRLDDVSALRCVRV